MCIRDRGGTEIIIDDREVQRQIYYGYVEKNGQAPPETRHHLTNRIEGKGMYWMQDTGIETLEFYSSVVSTNFVELTRLMDELGYCSPSDYVLINDNMFIYNRTECEFSGIFTSYVVDLFTRTQVGVRPVSYTHLRAHETPEHLVCRLLLEKKNDNIHL